MASAVRQNKARTRGQITLNRRTFAYPYVLFMLLFVIVPMFILLRQAFLDTMGEFTWKNFEKFFLTDIYMPTLTKSIWIAFEVTVICLAIGYPCAYILAQPKYNKSSIFVMLFIVPMWVNMLLRTLATKYFLYLFPAPDGLGMEAVMFGLVYNFLPFMILPIHTCITNIDKTYVEAARDLGANETRAMLRVTLPLSLPGIVSGVTMVFVPTISTFAITQMLSAGRVNLFGDVIQRQFERGGGKGIGSVMSIVMLAIVLIFNILLNKFSDATNAKKDGSTL